MEVTVIAQEPVTVLAVQGSVDGLTAEPLTQAFAAQIEAGHNKLVADMSGVSYISSAGLRALLITLKSCRAKSGDFRLAAVQPAVLSVLSMAGFTKLIKVFDSTTLAAGSFDS
ncbi:MAG: STAS domain-containing protein [Burkholderiales bacterium]|nr:STAS domain-containing protein [Burkholderiales bacterium]